MLRPQPPRAHRRAIRLATAVVAALVLTATATSSARAESIPPPQPDITVAAGAGVCAVAGTMTEQFSPAVGVMPATVTATIIGSGTCVGNGGTNTIYLNVGGPVLLSCAGGFGSVGGQVSSSNGFPAFTPVTGQYIGGPASEQLDLLGPSFAAIADLSWPTSAAACALTGTTSTPVYGTVMYVVY